MEMTILIIVVALIVASFGAWQSAHARHEQDMQSGDRRRDERRRD